MDEVPPDQQGAASTATAGRGGTMPKIALYGVAAAASLAALSLGAVGPAGAQALVGRPAPAFTLADTSGRGRALADFAGKTVVLEWWNPECPFVGKHYGSGNMQRLQREWTAKGVAWLTINSSAAGHQGHVDGPTADGLMRARGGAQTAVLLDPDGKVGRAYGAKTTPHMFVIDKAGVLVYEGGIDDRPSTDQADVPAARNYVAEALAAVSAGRAVSTATTTPYGCGVKYASR
jgi:peroxiredoxin